ncbi:unnamed protein product [Pleuronectes platessa]|uniref:Uncharacterized protein n=1 Tax=Pleuronectes platessa TaxID=8262 RepID=A0A9N7US16_PLEPL|nr:unnamed protein product [Pleuronectes platessa]
MVHGVQLPNLDLDLKTTVREVVFCGKPGECDWQPYYKFHKGSAPPPALVRESEHLPSIFPPSPPLFSFKLTVSSQRHMSSSSLCPPRDTCPPAHCVLPETHVLPETRVLQLTVSSQRHVSSSSLCPPRDTCPPAHCVLQLTASSQRHVSSQRHMSSSSLCPPAHCVLPETHVLPETQRL